MWMIKNTKYNVYYQRTLFGGDQFHFVIDSDEATKMTKWECNRIMKLIKNKHNFEIVKVK